MPAIFLIAAINLAGLGIVHPLLPFQVAQLGADPTLVDLVIASYTAVLLMAAPFCGRLSDRIGRKNLILLGLVGTALSYVWLGRAGSLSDLFLSRSLAGFSTAAILPVLQAYISDHTPAKGRAAALGMINGEYGFLLIRDTPAVGMYVLNMFCMRGSRLWGSRLHRACVV